MAIYKLGDICIKISAGGDMPSDRAMSKNASKLFPIVGNGIGASSILGYTSIPKTPKNVISISARGTIGHIRFWPESIYPVVRLITLEADNKFALEKYLYYLLTKTNFTPTGAVQKQLPIPLIKSVELEIVNLKEQQQIIDIIEPIEYQIKRIESSIDKIKQKLSLSYSFSNTPLAKFMDFAQMKTKKYNNQSEYLATNAFSELDVDLSKIQSLRSKIPSRANLSPSKKSIIFSKLVGENKVFYFEKEPSFVISTGFYNIQSEYTDHLMGFILSGTFKKQKELFSSGTTMVGLNNQGLNNIKIKKPTTKGGVLSAMLAKLIELKCSLEKIKFELIKLLIK